MALLQDLIQQIGDEQLRDRILKETDKLLKQKKFGLVFEEHLPECTPLYDVPVKVGSKVARKIGYVSDIYTVLKLVGGVAVCERRETHEQIELNLDDIVVVAEFGEAIYPTLKPIDYVENAPDSDLWHTLIEADNYHALQLLEYLYAGKVDCIYIDPPYNTGAKDWKYNNDYVDANDVYRHSKWLSMMEKRLKLAKKLLNPADSVLIVTIDERENNHLWCLLEDLFPEAQIQVVTDVINPKGVAQDKGFSRVEEDIIFVKLGHSSPVLTIDNMLDDVNDIFDNPKGTIWLPLKRSGSSSLRIDRPKMCYPIYVDSQTGRIVNVGDAPDLSVTIESCRKRNMGNNIIEIWPVSDDKEGRWRLGKEKFKKRIELGSVRAKFYKDSWIIQYLNEGALNEIEDGSIKILGKSSDGTLMLERVESKLSSAKTVWKKTTHDATTHGSNFLLKIFPNTVFSYPKSIYSTRDAIYYFMKNKPSGLIVDFFAGSGTTLNAINLLNLEDNGNRRCILVTNNEVSVEESSKLFENNYRPGDNIWEQAGVANSVTWPRTVCTIKGISISGETLDGEYYLNAYRDVEIERTFKKISVFDNVMNLSLANKKEIVALCCKGTLPQSKVKNDSKFVVSDKIKHTSSILFDDTAVNEWLESLEDMEHVTDFYILTKSSRKFTDIKRKINDLLGDVKKKELIKVPMSCGFKANAAFFKLTFLDKNSIALGRQFKELLPVLWMKAGGVGKCPTIEDKTVPEYMVLPKNKMAILTDELYYPEFEEEVSQHPEISTIFIVTDSENAYKTMIKGYDDKECYQLYRDYLDNFRINMGR